MLPGRHTVDHREIAGRRSRIDGILRVACSGDTRSSILQVIVSAGKEADLLGLTQDFQAILAQKEYGRVEVIRDEAEHPHGAGRRSTRGARPGLRGGVRMAALGVAAGAALAFLLARVAGGLLVGVSPHDPLTYVGLAALLMGMAGAAAYVPARRATALDALSSRRE